MGGNRVTNQTFHFSQTRLQIIGTSGDVRCKLDAHGDRWPCYTSCILFGQAFAVIRSQIAASSNDVSEASGNIACDVAAAMAQALAIAILVSCEGRQVINARRHAFSFLPGQINPAGATRIPAPFVVPTLGPDEKMFQYAQWCLLVYLLLVP